MVSKKEDTKKLLDDDIPNGGYGSVAKISDRKRNKDRKQTKNSFSLFLKFATRADIALMLFGAFFAVISGTLLPVLGLFFGSMTNAFINQATNGLVPDEVANTLYTNLSGVPLSTNHNETLANVHEFKDKIFYLVEHVTKEWFIADNPLAKLKNKNSTMIPLTTSEFRSLLNQYFIIYMMIGIIMFICAFLQSLCWEFASEHMVHNIRKIYLSQILRQDISWYDQNDNGNLCNKLADDCERVREGTGYKCALIVQHTFTFIGGVIVGLLVNVQLTLIILCVSPFLIALNAYTFKFGVSSVVREQQKYAAAGTVAEEALTNIKTVNAFGGQSVEIKKYNYWLEEGRKEAMKKYDSFAIVMGINFLMMYGVYAIGFAVGSHLVQIGTSSAGSVFTVFFSVIVGSVSIGQSIPYWNAVSGTIAVLSSINDIVERKVIIDPYAKTGRKPARFTGLIEFINTSFAYPTRPEIMILNNLNLVVEPGKRIAIVGSSGGGKSTIISLILRFYDPVLGEVCIDGISTKDYNVQWLRRQIGLVSQEPVLFGTSIAENISFGAEDVSREEIIEAAKQANAHEFISNLPYGYETLVGDSGSQLSGGQKQRIAIARALVRNPKILLLDEATSALDAKSEGIVQDTLDKIMAGRTTVIVAHRLSTIRNADVICVMQGGQMVERGNHIELMDKHGLYYELIQAQMSQEKSPISSEGSNVESNNSTSSSNGDNAQRSKEALEEMKKMTRASLESSGKTTDGNESVNLEFGNNSKLPSLDSSSADWKTVSDCSTHTEKFYKILDRKIATKTVSDDDDDEYETVIVRVRETREILYSDEEEQEDEEGISANPSVLVNTSTPINNSKALRPRKRTSNLEMVKLGKENIQVPIPSENMEKGISVRTFIIMQLPEWPWLLLGITGFICVGLIMPLFSLYYGAIFHVFTLAGDDFVRASKFWTFMFIGFAMFCGFAYCVQIKGITHANEKLIARSRGLVFENILRQPVGWFDLDSSSPGILVNRLARNAPLIKAAAGMRMGQVLSAGITVIAASVIAFACGWKLALTLIAIVPIIIFLTIKQQRVMSRNINRDVKLMDKAGRIASETVRNIRTVQALGRELLFTEMYSKNLDAPYKEGKFQAINYAVLYGATQGLMYFMYAVAFRTGGYLVELGSMHSDDMYRVFFALSLCASSVGTAFAYMQDYNKARYSVRLLNYLLTRPSEIDSSSRMGAKPEIKGRVEFKNVHFNYPTRATVKILRGLSFHVEEGKTLALVGESGCGKSTVISLLERFYDPDSGSVHVDGYDIRTLNLKYLRSKIGLVTQEPILFDASIKDNIAYGAIAFQDYVSFEQVKNAAVTANIHDFIMGLPERYDTMVGERGVQLSGGQKQRVAIARALIRNPKILLLDEATSALDTENEQIVQAALDEAKVGRTCIVIAHRLSTIQNADVICVVQKGKIVEQGTHYQLETLNGQYYQLTRRQRLS